LITVLTPSPKRAAAARRDPDCLGDLLAGPALAAQRLDALGDWLRRRPMQAVWPRAAVEETG